VKRRLAKLGLRTVEDLLLHRPHRYEDPAPERAIADLFGEDEVVIAGMVQHTSVRRTSRRLSILRARVADETGVVVAVWFNQVWLADKLAPGTRVRLRGQLRGGDFAVKAYDLDAPSATADYAPVYPASEEVTPKKLRELVEIALPYANHFVDPLPAAVREGRQLAAKADAVVALHRPRVREHAEDARRRLAFEELLVLQLGIARLARAREHAEAPALAPPRELIERYRRALPFSLTPHQEHAIAEIDGDLARAAPMQRLLQGDVGSGKTAVALYALLRAVENGRRGALMAPTETLAEQHFLTIEPICVGLGVTCALLTSSVGVRERRAAAQAQIVVGTHALIQEGVDLRDLAVAVIDEQHRFGVEQRKALAEGRRPHVLHMTATPIPRTLALTVYGDLAVSEIAEPPANRKPIVTSWTTEDRASEAYRRLTRLLREGRQAYVVCPLIEETHAGARLKPGTGSIEGARARAAAAEAERLASAELRDFRVACLHGKLKPDVRRDVMARFKAGEIDVLVATTVIEVGVDVPNATVMIVQEADRFGLAQLHQLRGRVGRGAEQSYCLLVSRAKEELTELAQRRLQALVDTTDGFELAEIDLELRGEGDLLGTRQHGALGLRFASLRGDRDLLELARRDAQELVELEGPLGDLVAAAEPAP
jgi:ATP-dependent DNA helicase RecG